ncbi:MAG TPA: site-specific DNA-methyltransferase, partial [Alphaproteobacteria bacterium]|nr:site-specific DNA-methyltransferase [Alphaproteobacteria bacterium]
VLLVSINDENRSKLDMLLESVFPGMRLGSFIWRNRQGSNADQDCFLSTDHEHVLVYGGPEFSFKGTEKTYEMYSNPDNDPRGDWRTDNLTLGYSYKDRPNLYYPLLNPQTGVYYPANPDGIWRYASRDRLKPGARVQAKPMEEFIELGQIVFPQDQQVAVWETMDALLAAIDAEDVPKSGKTPLLRRGLPDLDFWVGRKVGFGRPQFKRYKADLKNRNQPVSSWISPKFEAHKDDADTLVSGTNQEGAKLMSEIFDDKRFSYPKPLSLLQVLIMQATQANDIVLDFFAGSGTTGHAVMTVNAEDGGNRRFIMLSNTEETDRTPDKNLCADVCAERIKRVIRGYKKTCGLPGNFAYLRARRIPAQTVFTRIQHEHVWTALQLIHTERLAGYEARETVQAAAFENGDGPALVAYVPKLTETALAKIKKHIEGKANVTVYSWQPALLKQLLDNPAVTYEPIPQFLVDRFGTGAKA